MKEDILYLIETLNMTDRQTYQRRLTDSKTDRCPYTERHTTQERDSNRQMFTDETRQRDRR